MEDNLCLRCGLLRFQSLSLFLGLVEMAALFPGVFCCRRPQRGEISLGEPVLLEEEEHMDMPVVCVVRVDGCEILKRFILQAKPQHLHCRVCQCAKIKVSLCVFHQWVRADDGSKAGCPLPSFVNTIVCLVFVSDAVLVVERAGDGWLFAASPVDNVAET